MVLVQSGYNKCEVPAESRAVETTNHTPERHMELLEITVNSEMTKVLICLCLFSHVGGLVKEDERTSALSMNLHYTSHLSKGER